MTAPKMLFVRDYQGYTGGHGKVRDYIEHALALGWEASLHLLPGSRRHPGDPWEGLESRLVADMPVAEVDAVFVAGNDWNVLPPIPRAVPVINLIQGLRHAEPGSTLRDHLRRPALRICVSHAVAEALAATGEVCGPVRVIPAAIRLPQRLAAGAGGPTRAGVFVDGSKRSGLAADVADILRAGGHAVHCLQAPLPRDEYLSALAAAEVAVVLPLPSEGFYLPALEAMALGTPVVTLDAGGNREYLQPGTNALVPAADAMAIADEVHRLLRSPDLRAALRFAGCEQAMLHRPGRERSDFSSFLDKIGDTWNTVIATSH